MNAQLRVCGQPIQSMLVPLPIALFAFATVFDLAHATGAPPLIGTLGYWTAIAGLSGAVASTAIGMIDLWDVPHCPSRRMVVTVHAMTVGAALVFVIGCLVRAQVADRTATAGVVVLQLAAVALGAAGLRVGARLLRQLEPARPEAATLADLVGAVPAARAGNRLPD